MSFYAFTVLVTALPEDAGAAVEAHRDQVHRRMKEGRARAAGEFPGGDGFLEILEAKDRVEAERIARTSPLVKDGLATWTVREITPF